MAQQLLDAVAGKPCFDIIQAYARPLPVTVIAEMLGVDPARRDDFIRWSEALIYVFTPIRTPEQEEALAWAGMALDDFFKAAIDARRGARGDDLISSLVAAEEDGERLSESEIIGTCNLLLLAGNLTTTDLIGNGVLALLRHPDQLALLRSHPELAANMVEETLRFEPPVTNTSRVPREAREIGGVMVEPGQPLSVFLLAAGRDPAANPEPDRFEIRRPDSRHLSFGGGAHFCLGAPLARAEGEIAIPLLFERFPGLHLDPDQPVRRKDTHIFNGLQSLWLRT